MNGARTKAANPSREGKAQIQALRAINSGAGYSSGYISTSGKKVSAAAIAKRVMCDGNKARATIPRDFMTGSISIDILVTSCFGCREATRRHSQAALVHIMP